MSARPDGRALNALRPVEMTVGFHRMAEGSVLYRAGSTVVLATASVDEKVPAWMEGKGKGWVTAEYQMHPRSNPVRREGRDGRGKAPSGRTQEIQRLVGRGLRAAVDLVALGERQISIDCDVLEADGGTRTASITAGFVALCVALQKLRAAGKLDKPVVREPVAAISVGYLRSELALDLVYAEDSKAEVDLNLVATRSGQIIEVQGTAEGEPVPRKDVIRMMDLALGGIEELTHLQEKALGGAGVDLGALTIPARKGS
ncbi:MAG: ribonuclease PH [Labilithrix sp.]|nr:ribonuclease PH [Labilithrix sp.]